MRKELTPEEVLSDCMTVGGLVKALLELPQDAVLVRQAGGDCDGYVGIEKKELKAVWMGLRKDFNTHPYHGAFDKVRERNKYDYVGFVMKFEAVEL